MIPLKTYFTREIPLPVFSKQALFYSLLLVLSPNIVFLLLAWLSNTARPLINLDYFIAVLLLALPSRVLKGVGVLFFFIAVLFDVAMFVMQLFPFMDFAGVLYLMPFIKNAPTLYQASAAIFAIYLLLMPWAMLKLAKQVHIFYMVLLCGVLMVLAHFTGHLQYHERPTRSLLFGNQNFYYGKSQWGLYQQNQQWDFLRNLRTAPAFSKLEFERAARHLNIQEPAKKVLFILNESWGAA